MWGSFFPLRKGIPCVQRIGRSDRSRDNLVMAFCVSRTTAVWKVSWSGSRLGAHTNLDQARKGCIYVKVGIPVAVTKGVFVTENPLS